MIVIDPREFKECMIAEKGVVREDNGILRYYSESGEVIKTHTKADFQTSEPINKTYA